MEFTETIFAVRADMVDGSSVELLLFSLATDAEQYRSRLIAAGLPLGFESVRVVERKIIGPRPAR